MPAESESYPGFGEEKPFHCIQPGGGWGMRVELAWGKIRRLVLKTLFPRYVNRQAELRKGSCAGCPGKSAGCDGDIIDSRDLKYFRSNCGYQFPVDSDRFTWRRRIPFASWGLAELVVFSLLSALMGVVVGWLAWQGISPWVISLLGFAVFLFWLEILWFFRDPQRTIPSDPNAIVSPADGTIVDLAEVEAEGFPGKAFRVGIFLSIFNVHINRIPVAGVIKRLRYYPGRFLNAMKTISARQNEQLWIDMEQAGTKLPLRVIQISGALARRIVCELRSGQQVEKGEKFGMIKLGSRTELYLPANAEFDVQVKLGQKVKGGETVLLQLKSQASKN